MKQLKKDLLAVTGEIKKLAQRTDRTIKRLEKIEKTQDIQRSKEKKRGKTPKIDPILARVIRKKIYPTDIVLAHIMEDKDGIDINTLVKKTGLEYLTIKQIIHRLRNQGKVRSRRKEGLRGAAYGLGRSRTLYFGT